MPRVCEMCPEASAKPAAVFCSADACFLCPACDEEVHSANRLARRHVRRPVLHHDLADGSSINDDSELALVPDVAPESAHHLSDLDDPSSSNEMLLIDLPSQLPVSFEDAAEYDLCDFEGGLGDKMPALCAIDDDVMFADGKSLGKSFYADLSWENVVPDNIEHVVPDVSEPNTTPRSIQASPFARRDTPDTEKASIAPKVVSAPASARDAKAAKDKLRATTVVKRVVKEVKLQEKTAIKKEPTTLSCTSGTSIAGKKRAREIDVVKKVEPSDDNSSSTKLTEEEVEKDEETKHAEQRKKRRMEALVRFRSKRANRSFTKRVRYECRKQLADSRPRVKGRFVRKVEMALFRKYGALYREHLDELNQPAKIEATMASSPVSGSEQDRCVQRGSGL